MQDQGNKEGHGKHGAGKIETFIKTFDHWFATLTALPIAGFFITEAIERLKRKGVEKFYQRFENFVGLSQEDAKKSFLDEFLRDLAIHNLEVQNADKVLDFESRLRRKNREKAEAFGLYLANMLKAFKKILNEKEAPKEEQTCACAELMEGLNLSKKFLEALLRVEKKDADATFEAREKFLEDRNVFSLIKEKKESPPKGFPGKAKNTMRKTVESVDAKYDEGMDNLNSGLDYLLAKAKVWRDRA